MNIIFVAQAPPTPTLLPTPLPSEVAMGLQFDGLSLWDSAPHMIQWWHSMSTVMTFVQALLLLFIIMGAAMVLMRWFNNANRSLNE